MLNNTTPLTRKRFRKQLRQAALLYLPSHRKQAKKMIRFNHWLAGYARRNGLPFVSLGRPIVREVLQ